MRKLRNQNAEERMISIETPLLQFTEDELFPDPIDDSPSVIPGHLCEHAISSSSSSSSPSTKPNPEPELEPEIITTREPNVPSDECEHVNAVLEWELHNGQQVKFSLECVPNPNCEDLIKSGSREQHESPNSVPEGKDFLIKPLIEIDGVGYYPHGSKFHFNEMPNHDHNPQRQPNLSHELDLPPPLEDDVNNDQEQQEGSPEDVTLEKDFEDQESALPSEYCMRKKRNLMYISPSNSDEDDEPIPRFLSIEKSHKPHRIIQQSANYYSPEVRQRRGANGNHTPAEMGAHVAVGGGEEDVKKKRQEYDNSSHAFEHHGEMVQNGVPSQEHSVMGSSEKLDMVCHNKQQEPIHLNIDSETPIGAAVEEGREEAPQIHQGADEEEILVLSDDTNSDSIPSKNSQVRTTHRPLYPYESDSDEKEEEEGQTPWYYTFQVSEKRAGELESESHIVTEIKSDNENIGRVNSDSDKLGTPPQTNEQPCDHCAVKKEKLGETDGEIRPNALRPQIEQSADEEDFFAQLEFHLLSQMNDELGHGDWKKELCRATSEDHDISQLASFSAHRNSLWEEKEVILALTLMDVNPLDGAASQLLISDNSQTQLRKCYFCWKNEFIQNA